MFCFKNFIFIRKISAKKSLFSKIFCFKSKETKSNIREIGSMDFKILPKNIDFAETFDVYLCNDFSLPSFAIKFLQEIASDYEAREDDIHVISYPKSGTTWLQEIVFLVQSNLDFKAAKEVDLWDRFPYVEHTKTNFDKVKNMQSPRLLKTHLPYSLLPPDIHRKKCKLLYITRNPRDVAISYYHFACMIKETSYKGTFEQFFNRFLADRPTYGPFLKHNLEFWNHRKDENVLFLFYEDFQKDVIKNIKAVAEFLGKSYSPDELQSIADYCGFQRMSQVEDLNVKDSDRAEGATGRFFRKGKVGDWKNYFTPQMIASLDQKVSETLKDSGLQYTYEI